jgi:inhibitor of cysteine peptidase
MVAAAAAAARTTMRPSRSTVQLLAALAILLAASASTLADKLIDVSDPDDGGSVQMSPGDTLRVRLHATPGTGYSWTVGKVDAAALAESAPRKFVPPPQQIPGAEGHDVFEFRAARSGRTSLELRYLRPWEKNTPPARIFHINVNVE